MAGIALVSTPITAEDRQCLDDELERMAASRDSLDEELSDSDEDIQSLENDHQKRKNAESESQRDPSNCGHSSFSQSTDVSELQKDNKKLQEENKLLKEEMEQFEGKMKFLEYTLGVVDGDGIADISTFVNPQDLLMEGSFDEYDDYTDDGDDYSNKKFTAPVVTADIPVGKPVSDEKGESAVNSKASRGGHSEEIKILLAKNQNMLTAIKALARAAMAQKKKHDQYKGKSNAAKKKNGILTKKLSEALLEKQEHQTSYLDTRSLLLKEKVKMDELQSQITNMSFQMKTLKKMDKAQRVEMNRILKRLGKKIENDDVSSDSLRMKLAKKKDIIVQMQSKINLATSYMKRTKEADRFTNDLCFGSDGLESDGFVILSNKSTKSTTESEVSC